MNMPELDAQSISKWKARYFTIWSGQAFSMLGSQVVQFAIIWWIARESNSATVLTFASIAGLVPAIALGPLVGALVDRWNRRIIMIASDLCTALLTLGLFLLFITGQVESWHIYVMLFFRSIAGAFHSVSMQSSTSLLVPKEHLVRVEGVRQMLDAGLSIGAPFLGSLALGTLPIEGIILMDTFTCLFAVQIGRAHV